jgi:hypothetical protein
LILKQAIVEFHRTGLGSPLAGPAKIRLQICRSEIVQWSTETLQCAQYGIGIAWRRHDPDVNIHRGAEITVGRQRISANEQKFSLLFD